MSHLGFRGKCKQESNYYYHPQPGEAFLEGEESLSVEYRSIDTFGDPDSSTYKPGIASGMVRENSSIATDRGRRYLSLITGDSAFI